MTVNWASSNFTPQVKQAMNLGQILIGNRFHVTLRIVSPYILFKVNRGVVDVYTNGICGLSGLVLGSDGWMQGKRFTRGTSIDLPPVQHSLRKQARGPRCKEGGMGAADHS